MQYGGTQLVTADGVVGTSGSPVRIYAIHILSGAGGSGTVQLRSGTGASGTIYVQEAGTANEGRTVLFGTCGYFFPSGCYADIDSDVTSVAVSYIQQ